LLFISFFSSRFHKKKTVGCVTLTIAFYYNFITFLNCVLIRDSYHDAVMFLKTHYYAQPEYLHELELCTADGEPTGGGYVVESVRSAKYLLFKYDNYENVVKGAVSLGNDTDTTAAIAGGLAGIAFGSIPDRWSSALRGKDAVDELLKRLSD